MNSNLSKLFLPVAIIIAGGLIAWGVYYSGSPKPAISVADQKSNGDAYVASLDIAPVTSVDHIQGSIDAKVTIIEYSDTECPFCKVFHQVLTEVYNDYNPSNAAAKTATGTKASASVGASSNTSSSAPAKKVAWVFRHFPIAELHEKAAKEAEATECAAELGGENIFWKYIGTIYTNTPSNDGLDSSQLGVFADQVGIDKKAFQTCLDSGKYTAKINESIKAGMRAGADATPYTVLIVNTANGNVERVPLIDPNGASLGALPYATMKNIIERLLNS